MLLGIALGIVFGLPISCFFYLSDRRSRKQRKTLEEAIQHDEDKGKTLSLLERFNFDGGEFSVDVGKGSDSTLIHFTHSVAGEVSGGDHLDEVLIWIPTKNVKDLKDAL